MGYFFIALMLALTLYGQIVIKWRVSLAGAFPADSAGQLAYVGKLLLSPWVLSGLFAAFAASVCWILALTKLADVPDVRPGTKDTRDWRSQRQ